MMGTWILGEVDLFHSAVTIRELLRRTKGCLMHVLRAFDQAKAYTKLIVQGIRVITHDVQAAAFCRALWAEGTDDDMPSGFNRTDDLSNVGEVTRPRP